MKHPFNINNYSTVGSLMEGLKDYPLNAIIDYDIHYERRIGSSEISENQEYYIEVKDASDI
jgi:hypothetical protein